MADLSKIKLNGTTYNFKDTVARNYATEEEILELLNSLDIVSGQSILSVRQMTTTDTSATLDQNILYVWPEMAELSISCPLTGHYAFRFTSGATATNLTLPSGVIMPTNFIVEANMVYEINILEGYGTAAS